MMESCAYFGMQLEANILYLGWYMYEIRCRLNVDFVEGKFMRSKCNCESVENL